LKNLLGDIVSFIANPEVIKSAAEQTAAQGDDCICAIDTPEHA
jgi:hypothetical protein